MNCGTFQKNIKALRMAKKLTQEQLAEKCGVSAQMVSRWETGVTLPDVMLLPVLAQIFGVLVDDLYKEETVAYPNLAHRLMSVYEGSGKHEDFLAAAKEFEKLVQNQKATAEDYRSYGILHEYMLKICKRDAMRYYDKAMELSQGNDVELFYRTKRQKQYLRICIGQGEACVAEQEQTAQREPDNLEEQLCLLVLYYDVKQLDKGYALFCKLKNAGKESSILYSCGGDICKELGNVSEAFTYWNKAYELDPRFLDSLFSIAFYYEEIQEYQKAYEAWNRITQILLERGLNLDITFSSQKAEKCKEKWELSD